MHHYRRNSDTDIRYYQRLALGGDIQAEAKVLSLRRQAGNLDPHHVELAAYLGDEASLLVSDQGGWINPCPYRRAYSLDLALGYRLRVRLGKWTPGPEISMQVLRWGELDQRLLVKIAADFAQHSWEIYAPDDGRPALAIQAARDWVDGLLYDDDDDVARAAARAVDYYATQTAADSVARAAANAAYAACQTTGGPAYFATQTALYSLNAAWVREVEEEWQRLHLIEVLLGNSDRETQGVY